MTRTENMRRLWRDPEFREKQAAGATRAIMAVNATQWTPARRAQAGALVRERNLAKAREKAKKRLAQSFDVSRGTVRA